MDRGQALASPLRPTWCNIDLAQLTQNIRLLRQHVCSSILLVVKANAYGHGLVEVARAAMEAGAVMLGVGTVDEADTLLESGVKQPILVLSGLSAAEIRYCVGRRIHFLAWRKDQFLVAGDAASRYGNQPLIHLELDTGMSRTGCAISRLPTLISSLTKSQLGTIVGLCTQFHSADYSDLQATERQVKDFEVGAAIVRSAGKRPLRHVANSSGALRLSQGNFDMVRLGLAAYGIRPSISVPVPKGVSPILSWSARLVSIEYVNVGDGIGYGHAYRALEGEWIGTLQVGYADGFRRYPPDVNEVLIEGSRWPVVGNVCMDQCMVRVSSFARIGDTVVLLGESDRTEITAEGLAARWHTNSYDVLAGIRARIPRVFADS